MPYTVDVALAAPLWKALSYAVPAELVNLVKPLSRLLVPLRGGRSLGFALGGPVPGDAAGLKPILDVLDEVESAQAVPAELLQFYQRAASYYQVPLGQVLAQSLPAGMGTARPKGGRLPKAESVALISARQGLAKNLPRVGTQADRLLRLLQKQGPYTLPDLRKSFTQAGALCKRLEAAGWVEIHQKPLVRDLLGNPLIDEPAPECLNPDQAKAVKQINKHVDSTEFKAILLFGVTGSGKTEVYLAACERALRNGRQALILVPEIGLCLRLEGFLKSRLGAERVAVLHSGLTPAARRGQWMAIARGGADVVVGARSAVFAPLKNPGVICVDEEQDEAYKQEDRFTYNGRDLALLRGQEQGCPVVMGTATPSASTWHRASRGGYKMLRLPKRVNDAALPKMSLVDLRAAGRLKAGFMSNQLHQALKKTVSAGNQAMLFLNRRGYAPALICSKCGKTTGCPSCSLSLTVHRAAKRLTCHTCGYTQALPKACPHCGAGAEELKPLGLGTEAVVDRLAELEPEWRIARLDRDTAADAKSLRALLKMIADHEVDVVVGTQMITKGHHFPRIGLVGVLLADQALAVPDFRAAERAYVLITQVAGRAGRGGGPGLVMVQTYDPENHAVRAALAHDPQAFYSQELEERRFLGYPPFVRLISLRLESSREADARRAAEHLARHLRLAQEHLRQKGQVLGPAPAPVIRVQSRFRYLILLKSASAKAAGQVLRLALHNAGTLPAAVRLKTDVDPLTIS